MILEGEERMASAKKIIKKEVKRADEL